MTNQEYQKDLEGKKVPELKELYNKTFGTPPASKKKKADLINDLVQKFSEINDDPNAEVVEETTEEVKVEAKPPSRRSTIIDAIKLHIWDRNTLAEYLHMINTEWPIDKNKAAISGTIADLRANKGWTCKIADDGRISTDPA